MIHLQVYFSIFEILEIKLSLFFQLHDFLLLIVYYFLRLILPLKNQSNWEMDLQPKNLHQLSYQAWIPFYILNQNLLDFQDLEVVRPNFYLELANLVRLITFFQLLVLHELKYQVLFLFSLLEYVCNLCDHIFIILVQLIWF